MAKKAPAKFKNISKAREIIIQILQYGWEAHRMHAYGQEECDDALKRLKIISEKLGRKISLTAWFVTCWASTVGNHKILQAYPYGRKKMIIFDEVDCVVNIEKNVGDRKVPTAYVVRNADKKNVIEISDEIREAQKDSTKQDSAVAAVSSSSKSKASTAQLVLQLPRFLRKLIIRRATKDPYLKKKAFGTIGLSSIGMFTSGGGSAISLSMHASTMILGGVSRRPWVSEGSDEVTVKYVYDCVFSMSHDLVDGGPAARAIAEFRTKTRTAYGLDEIEKELGIQ